MAFDWTTFILEIINFLALVWILKRFLYQPVLATLAERRAGIERTLNEAKDKETHAETLKTQYESRLSEWEQEKSVARAHFTAELTEERQRQMEALAKEIALERERNQAQDIHRQEILKRELITQCNTQARLFANKLLSKLASPELESRLVALFIEEIDALPDERISAIQLGLEGNTTGCVTSAFPLSEAQQQMVIKAIDDHFEIHSQLEFLQDKALLAGLKISLGAWQLELSFAGELNVYAEASGFGQ
ncbi:F0F1 ATP synthase subunit delta [Tolumonas lignilytica]|uniref:F0F1 ATP synthase subunit delta n=1 Tax=Tolumonas lignilytica TaxID=1283284 RepID=UPI0004656190|nr:F0F1 ATP synthase subunit delta [Tolumonas lignilytica]